MHRVELTGDFLDLHRLYANEPASLVWNGVHYRITLQRSPEPPPPGTPVGGRTDDLEGWNPPVPSKERDPLICCTCGEHFDKHPAGTFNTEWSGHITEREPAPPTSAPPVARCVHALDPEKCVICKPAPSNLLWCKTCGTTGPAHIHVADMTPLQKILWRFLGYMWGTGAVSTTECGELQKLIEKL